MPIPFMPDPSLKVFQGDIVVLGGLGGVRVVLWWCYGGDIVVLGGVRWCYGGVRWC
jgi:hypothetical protein